MKPDKKHQKSLKLYFKATKGHEAQQVHLSNRFNLIYKDNKNFKTPKTSNIHQNINHLFL